MLQFTITVEEDLMPEFALNTTIDNQTYIEDDPIVNLTLPTIEDGSGNGTIDYSLTPELPNGLDFDEDTRVLSGTPTDEAAAATYTYTATDEDNDEVTLQFTITVLEDLMPEFALSTTIDNQTYRENSPIDNLTLPAVEDGSGNGVLTYSLSGVLPDGLDFDEDTRILSGTPAAGSAAAAATYTYTATDKDNDMVTLQFTIAVEEDLMPEFGAGEMIANQIYTEELESYALTLPAVSTSSSGNGTLTYSLSKALPDGLDFDEDTRILSGTPAAGSAAAAATYIYTATDDDNDEVTLQFTITVRAASTVTAMLNSTALSVTASSTTNSTIMLTMNVAWEATESASWITGVSPDEGSGSSSAQAIQIDYTANNRTPVRTEKVIFTETTEGASPALTAELTVTQAGTVEAGLIPINTLEQLNAIRYDLDGDGEVDDAANSADYASAFPNVVYNFGWYNGYKLTRDLDFKDDPSSYDPATATTNRAKWTPNDPAAPTNPGWEPIGYYTSMSDNAVFSTTFDGQGHKISNLYIKRTGRDIGLFGRVHGAQIRNLGLMAPAITGGDNDSVGGIVGQLQNQGASGGQIRMCYVSGGTITGGASTGATIARVGGIAGYHIGSWTLYCYVASSTIEGGAGAEVGGIVGKNPDGGGTIGCYVASSTIEGEANAKVGGLLGRLGDTGNDSTPLVVASYVLNMTLRGGSGASTGSLVGEQATKGTIFVCYAGGTNYTNLVGTIGGTIGTDNNLQIVYSYYETSSASAQDDGNPFAQPKSATALKTPTAYGTLTVLVNGVPTPLGTIYGNWNIDWDNVDGDDDPETGTDNPWNFGTNQQYPVLKADFNAKNGVDDDVTRQQS